MGEVGRREQGASAWVLAVVGGALASVLGSYLIFLFPPTKVFAFTNTGDREPLVAEEKVASGSPGNEHFNVLIQYYPSTSVLAGRVRKTLEQARFNIAHFRQLAEGKLSPRQSEIIYYSPETQAKAQVISRLIALDLNFGLPLAKSPYYGDSKSQFKIFVNLLSGSLSADATNTTGEKLFEGWVYLGTFEDGAWVEQSVSVSRHLPRAGDWLRVTADHLNVRGSRPKFPFYRLAPVIGGVSRGALIELIEIVPDVGENRVWAFVKTYA